VAADYDGIGEFRGASFTGADFTAANFRDCDLRQAKITDSWPVDVRMSGLVENFVVNDVDVTAFVEGELDKRHPERVQLRKPPTTVGRSHTPNGACDCGMTPANTKAAATTRS
jgi:Pentapeptide repeats (8 copies)